MPVPDTSFSLHPQLQKAVEKMGWDSLTDVQQQVIPQALDGRNLLVQAHTGSGKTGAFGLPMLHRILNDQRRNTFTLGLILSPTRELARQLEKSLRDMAAFTQIQILAVTGGQSITEQAAKLRKNPEIVIATPGRLTEHLASRTIDLSTLMVLVLDEADRMVEMGFAEDLQRAQQACPDDACRWLFSATLQNTQLSDLSRQFPLPPQKIEVSSDRPEIIQQRILADDPAHKQKLLNWLIHNEPYQKLLIFCNTRDGADQLGQLLRNPNIHVDVLHGEKPAHQRRLIVRHFMERGKGVLIATDVAARGLDIKEVDLVINYDMSRSGDEYVHRIGRTGRAGETGKAITLIMPHEWNLMASAERYLSVRMEPRVIESLKGHYKGPKKLKSSGKSATKKKKKSKDKKAVSRPARKPGKPGGKVAPDGMGVIRKKKP